MSQLAKILSLAYNSAVATKTVALKTNFRSLRLIKNSGAVNPLQPSYETNILLCGDCIDPENRNLYVFYIDTYFGSSWIIEINIDTRTQTVVYYDKYNAIGFDPLFKIHNARVVHGRLVWTENKNPIYMMDIARAKKSFALKIGYGQYPNTVEWNITSSYSIDQIVSNGNKYYKSLIDSNVGNKPKDDDGTKWTDLKCLIEDAYYSMNVENFYFEAMPPKLSPVVEYYSEDKRKINNLKRTLFQVAYRYVYMDWRKSTFSPASTVPLPQAEEEVTTGLANEVISLNNALKITVNTGGEEVRAIEIVARSSDDPSKWYLIETINKFDTQERAQEISRTAEPEYINATLTVYAPVVTCVGIVLASDEIPIKMDVIDPSTLNSYVLASEIGLSWSYNESGIGEMKPVTITTPPLRCYIFSKPDWISIFGAGGFSLIPEMTIENGEVLSVFPTDTNTGVARTGYVILKNIYGDSTQFIVSQNAYVIPPPVPLTPTISVDPLDTSGLVLTGASGGSSSGQATVTYSILPNHPAFSEGQTFTMYWRALVNGVAYGNGSFTAYDEQANNGTLTLNANLASGDVIVIYLSADSFLQYVPEEINVGLSIMPPEPTNSKISSSEAGFSFTGEQSGYADRDTAIITCPPMNCYLTSKPAWLTVWHGDNVTGYAIYDTPAPGWTIGNGVGLETISVFPTEDNPGSARSGLIVLTNAYGDTISITVAQAAAIAPPAGQPIYPTLQVWSGDTTGLTIPGENANAQSGSKIITWTALIAHTAHGDELWTMYWRVKVNGVLQGSGSFDAYNGSQGGEIVTDSTLLEGDVVVIDFSSVTF